MDMASGSGYHFYPTDRDLIDFLKRQIFLLYSCEPCDLQYKTFCPSREDEGAKEGCYLFVPRGQKYTNGPQMNRATQFGFWKSTGKDRPIMHRHATIGMKKTLVYHHGRAPNGVCTDWVMHEYRLPHHEIQDIYVLCRVFKKSKTTPSLDVLGGADAENDTRVRKEGMASLPDGGDTGKAEGMSSMTSVVNMHKEGMTSVLCGIDTNKEGMSYVPNGADMNKEGMLFIPCDVNEDKEATSFLPGGINTHKEGMLFIPCGINEDKEWTSSMPDVTDTHKEGKGFIPNAPDRNKEEMQAKIGDIGMVGAADTKKEGMEFMSGGAAEHKEGLQFKAHGIDAHKEGMHFIRSSEDMHRERAHFMLSTVNTNKEGMQFMTGDAEANKKGKQFTPGSIDGDKDDSWMQFISSDAWYSSTDMDKDSTWMQFISDDTWYPGDGGTSSPRAII